MDIGQPEASTSASPAYTYAAKACVDETWTRVEELPGDDDSDWSEEETSYVTLDFGPELPQDVLEQLDSLQLTNVHAAEPFARLGSNILRGRHEKLLGSELLFIHEPPDPETGKAPPLQLLGTTQDRVRFEKLTVKAKAPPIDSQKQNASSHLLTKSIRTGTAPIPRKPRASAAGGEGSPPGSGTPGTTRGRGRGRPRGRGSRGGGTGVGTGRGRGRGRRKSSSAVDVGSDQGQQERENSLQQSPDMDEGQSQFLAGDETGMSPVAGPSTSMADLPDIEEF